MELEGALIKQSLSSMDPPNESTEAKLICGESE